jgi:hypothetical protein
MRRLFGSVNPNTVKKIFVSISVLLALILGFVSSYIMTSGRLSDYYEKEISERDTLIESVKKTVYEAVVKIPRGEAITDLMVEKKEVYASNDVSLYMTDEDFGKLVLIDIAPGTFVTKSMLTDENVDSDLRETEFDVIYINSNITFNDYVDIRIVFPNGENYIVLTKKSIKKISDDGLNCFLWLNEEEILRMSSAIVDAYLYNGTKIYTTKYIEPNLQEELIVNYQPSLSTINIIKNNPNIVEIAQKTLSTQLRKEKENRLADFSKTNVNEIHWQIKNSNINDYSTSQNENTKNVVNDSSGAVTYQDQEREKEADKDYGP